MIQYHHLILSLFLTVKTTIWDEVIVLKHKFSIHVSKLLKGPKKEENIVKETDIEMGLWSLNWA